MSNADMFERTRIILIGTTHPGNIGAAARAMKTMGLCRLFLVQPQTFPSQEATARASGADDVLAQAEVCQTLDDALQGCHLVIGSTARRRELSLPLLSPRQCAEKIQQGKGDAAILFGREHSGLSNAELQHCHAIVQIPANPNYSSLNLASAVQVLSYEIRCATDLALTDTPPQELASHETMQRFYAHLEDTLIDLDFFDPAKPKKLLPRLHRLFNRAQLEDAEVNLLRGVLRAAQKAAKPPKNSV
jgi:tRNA (cytidine32/uridine32-2'-O)-methyltransferase